MADARAVAVASGLLFAAAAAIRFVFLPLLLGHLQRPPR
jgi:hypothetical protein